MTNEITTRTPAEIDGRIVELNTIVHTLYGQLPRLRETLLSLRKYDGTEADIAEATGKVSEASAQYQAARAELAELNAEFDRRGGWARYYLVANSNGHLHTTTACRNTYRTTPWFWVTGLSGATTAEAVARGGERSCLDCFPGHRAEIESGRKCTIETPAQRASREEREAKAAAKAAKLAKTGITNPDGTPLLLPDHAGRMELVKTENAANRRVMEAAYDLRIYADRPSADDKHLRRTIELGLAALAYKRGASVEDERAALTRKIDAKYRREMR